jgi:hypothetical protein
MKMDSRKVTTSSSVDSTSTYPGQKSSWLLLDLRERERAMAA